MKHNQISILLASLAFASAAWMPTSAQTAGLERRAEIESQYGVQDAEIRYNTKADLMQQPDRMGAEYFLYQFDAPQITPAPKGYKPFYISVTGRHGARYALGENAYDNISKLLIKAHSEGKLTKKGEDLYNRYSQFYPYVAFRGGDLTAKGQEQTRLIARTLYNTFPQLFKGHTVATAISTQVPRVIITMTTFLDEIRCLDKDFTYTLDAGRAMLPKLQPNGSKNPYRKEVPMPKEASESIAEFNSKFGYTDEFADKFFNDKSFLESNYGAKNFLADMRNIVTGIQCLDGNATSDKFEDVFTKDELFDIWETRNYFAYITYGRSPLADPRVLRNNADILADIIANADRNIASGKVQMDLKFTHDTALLPLISFMRLNNFGAVVEKPEDVKYFWRSDFMSMSSNLQLIFFRSKADKEILVKVLYNGHEASLPIQEVAPSFYSWTEFKDFYLKLLADK